MKQNDWEDEEYTIPEEVYHLKLVTGEDVITEIMDVDEENEVIVVRKPLKVHSVITDYRQSFFFTAWQPMTDNSVFFVHPSHLVTHTVCSEDIFQKYLEVLGVEEGGYYDEDDDDEDGEDDMTEVDALRKAGISIH